MNEDKPIDQPTEQPATDQPISEPIQPAEPTEMTEAYEIEKPEPKPKRTTNDLIKTIWIYAFIILFATAIFWYFNLMPIGPIIPINGSTPTPVPTPFWEKHTIAILCDNGSACQSEQTQITNLSEIIWLPQYNGTIAQMLTVTHNNDTRTVYHINVTEVPYYFDATDPTINISPGLKSRDDLIGLIMVEWARNHPNNNS